MERETVVRIAPPPFTKVYLEARKAAEREAALAQPRVPDTGRDWVRLLAVLADQLTDPSTRWHASTGSTSGYTPR